MWMTYLEYFVSEKTVVMKKSLFGYPNIDSVSETFLQYLYSKNCTVLRYASLDLDGLFLLSQSVILVHYFCWYGLSQSDWWSLYGLLS